MNNPEADRIINDCDIDLQNALSIVNSLGITSQIVPYLNKYGIVKACGSIEVAYKTIIADFCNKRSKQQVKNFINERIRESSSNPSIDNILRTLKSLDKDWFKEFKDKVKNHQDVQQIRTSIKSLVDARNDFAHGGNPTVSLNDTYQYFLESKKLIEILDSIVQ